MDECISNEASGVGTNTGIAHKRLCRKLVPFGYHKCVNKNRSIVA
jgi:hypothetical protein